MSNRTPHPIFAAVQAHIAQTGLKPSDFGKRAVGDANFVFQLEQGREPRRQTLQRVVDFISTGRTYQDLKAERVQRSNRGAA